MHKQIIYLIMVLVAEYNLTIDESNPYNVLIEATFFRISDTLFIHPACPNYDYPKPWKHINDNKFLVESKKSLNNNTLVWVPIRLT